MPGSGEMPTYVELVNGHPVLRDAAEWAAEQMAGKVRCIDCTRLTMEGCHIKGCGHCAIHSKHKGETFGALYARVCKDFDQAPPEVVKRREREL